MKQLTTFILFMLAITPACAQEFKLGKVTVAELEEKVHSADTSAPAAILHKRGKSYFVISSNKWMLVTEVEVRIKIYKKEGYDYAKHQVPYYTGGSSLSVFFNDAYTYNLAGGKIEKTKLRSDGEFEEKINDEFNMKKIVMPNVKAGSIIEYRYVVKTPYFRKMPDWYFQLDIPVNDITYEVAIPSCFLYSRHLQGYVDVQQAAQTTKNPIQHSYIETVSKFSAKNVKALKEENYVNNIRNYMSILKQELASVQYTGAIPEYYSVTWETMSKKIFEDKDFGKQLNEKSYFEDDIKALTSGNVSQDERIKRVFNYVKERMNWNGEQSYYTDKGVVKAYKDKVGNVAEINLMLTAMLRYADINANPVLVSTRNNGVALYPSTVAYDYIITAVKTDKGYILLDATSKYSMPDVIPSRCLNWVGRMIKENGSTEEIDLMPKVLSKEIINISVAIDAEGKATGRAVDQYFDNNALVFRESYTGINKDTYIERLEKYYKGMEIKEYSVLNDKDLTKPVSEDFTFEHTNVAEIIGDKMYVSPMLFLTKKVNPFKEEKREYPIDFTYQHQDRYAIIIDIPEGYTIESLPNAVSLQMEQNIGNFRYNIAQKDKQVQLSVFFVINYANISQEYYPTIKDFYRKMIEKQSEKIVLKKI